MDPLLELEDKKYQSIEFNLPNLFYLSAEELRDKLLKKLLKISVLIKNGLNQQLVEKYPLELKEEL
jgi:ferredoxin-fold anticodon binding domain-containing protein